jgi:hypothetical protein
MICNVLGLNFLFEKCQLKFCVKIFLFFACHAKKRNKRKVTTDSNLNLAYLHILILTNASQAKVRTIRGHQPTSHGANKSDNSRLMDNLKCILNE